MVNLGLASGGAFLLGRLQYADNLVDAPHVRGEASFHRGRHAKRPVNSAEVVVHVVERHEAAT